MLPAALRVRLLLLPLVAAALLFPARMFSQSTQTFGTALNGGTSYLGIGLVDVDATRARSLHMNSPQGSEITRVDDGSPADRAGLKPGDVLLQYNGETILGGQQLARLVSETPPGRHVAVQYWHAGKIATVQVVTAVRPRTAEPPPDSWMINPFPNTVEVPFPLLVWRNLMLGIECEALQGQLADYLGSPHGVLVRAVQRGSVADTAGMHAGDVVVAVGDHAIGSPRELTAILRATWVPGHTTRLQIVRDRKHIFVDLAVPADAQ